MRRFDARLPDRRSATSVRRPDAGPSDAAVAVLRHRLPRIQRRRLRRPRHDRLAPRLQARPAARLCRSRCAEPTPGPLCVIRPDSVLLRGATIAWSRTAHTPTEYVPPKLGVLLFDVCICALQLVFLVVSYELAHYELPAEPDAEPDDGDDDAAETRPATDGACGRCSRTSDCRADADPDRDPLLRSTKPVTLDPIDVPVITLEILPTLRRLFVVRLDMVDDKPEEGGSQPRPRRRRRRDGSFSRLSEASDEERNVGVAPSV